MNQQDSDLTDHILECNDNDYSLCFCCFACASRDCEICGYDRYIAINRILESEQVSSLHELERLIDLYLHLGLNGDNRDITGFGSWV